MARRRDRVLVEFTEDTTNAAGEIVRSKDDRVRVDPMSAKSFVEKGVARVVEEDAPTVLGAPADGEQGPAGEVTNVVTGETSTGVVFDSSIDAGDLDEDSRFGGN